MSFCCGILRFPPDTRELTWNKENLLENKNKQTNYELSCLLSWHEGSEAPWCAPLHSFPSQSYKNVEGKKPFTLYHKLHVGFEIFWNINLLYYTFYKTIHHTSPKIWIFDFISTSLWNIKKYLEILMLHFGHFVLSLSVITVSLLTN